jgi:hypothetical protein
MGAYSLNVAYWVFFLRGSRGRLEIGKAVKWGVGEAVHGLTASVHPTIRCRCCLPGWLDSQYLLHTALNSSATPSRSSATRSGSATTADRTKCLV